MSECWIYMTAGSSDEAGRIGRRLVESRLAACVNIIDGMNSLYMWEGVLQEDRETVMIAKTTEVQVPRLVETVKEMHSYECPCVLSLPVTGGNTEFLDWIRREVAAAT